jgi:hypothetical protein
MKAKFEIGTYLYEVSKNDITLLKVICINLTSKNELEYSIRYCGSVGIDVCSEKLIEENISNKRWTTNVDEACERFKEYFK